MLSAAVGKTVQAPGRYGDGHGGFRLSHLVRTTACSHAAKC